MAEASEAKSNHGYAAIAKAEVDEFLHATAFRALQFVKHSMNWVESLFWIVLIVGAAAFAIRDVRKVYGEYANEETFTSMHVKGLQKLTFEDAILCVEYNFTTIDLSDPLLEYHSRRSSITLKGFAAKANVSVVEFLHMSLKLFTSIGLIENGRTASYERRLAELYQDNGEELQRLKDWLKGQRVDVITYGRDIGNWFCRVLRIRIYQIRRGMPLDGVDPCDEQKISWLSSIPFLSTTYSATVMCVDIGGWISFDSMLDRVVISVDTGDDLSFSENNSLTQFITDSWVDFSGNPVSTDMTRSYITFPDSRGDCFPFIVGKDARLSQRDRQLARCNETAKTRFACYGGCEVLRFENVKVCNCTQLAWRYLYGPRERKMCFDVLTIKEHLDCRRALPPANFTNACYQLCVFPCTYQQIGISKDFNGPCRGERFGAGVSIELTPKQFTLTVFEEQFSSSVSELLSRIGGTCGLWLGVGMLGICHALLFPFKILSKFGQYGGLKCRDVASGVELK